MTTYVAKEDLFVGIHRAHFAGDVVPEENIEPNGWDDLVAREGTTAAAEAQSGEYDPNNYGRDEVLTYLRGASPEERQRVIDLERAGKGRSSILRRLSMPGACVMAKPRGITRRLQPAGYSVPSGELSYRDGFCLRLPTERILLVWWGGPWPATLTRLGRRLARG
jgi:hypothetical protein